MKNFFNYLLSWTSFNQNFAIFYALQRWVIQAKDIMERSFETCVGVAGHRFQTGSPAVAVAWPVPIWSRNRCNHVSSSAQQTLVRRRAEGRRPRCVRGEPFSVRADVAYLRALRRRFAPARVKSVPLPVPHAARDTVRCVQYPISPSCPLVSRETTCPFSSYLHNYVS